MCDSHKNDKNKNGDEDMAKVIDNIRVDISKSINNSFDDIEKIQSGKLPKHSYRHMINRVKQKLNEEKK